ncbi:hypothetical protein NEOLEDRAFT_1097916 [Neolentinus lepideus HHB14362 ss-1]|uniref:O-methyltransferase domain-containing protein n=1 Tax=Neolentinus lepideus HHB14362 ss-1 TaxID=1314782 RepID=A0A165QDD7_9AGAM|nr:hypothetical protein NEOLEDRAFT_1097916 [Neolentinus lepideus HHB14362 ss-1]
MVQISELSSLLGTLATSIDILQAELLRQGLSEPSLCTSRPHPLDDPSYLSPPKMYEAQRIAFGCLAILHFGLLEQLFSSGEVPGLRLVTELGIYEILEEVKDPEVGESLQVIAAETSTDASKLGTKHSASLTTRGWFRETKLGHFANSRRSHTLKMGSKGYYVAKNMRALFYTRSVGKLLELMTHSDETFRMSRNPAKTGWNLYTNSPMPVFGSGGLLHTNIEEGKKFALAVTGFGSSSNNAVMQDIPWMDIAKDVDAIVDIGGSQGALCCDLAMA